MSTRTYADRCGVARALDLVGERWALLVVRELLLGPKRFTDLRAGLPHIGPDILSQRIRELETGGLVERRILAPPSRTRLYALTARGQQLEPVILALGRFGSVAPFPDGQSGFGPDAAILALKTLFDPDAVPDAHIEVELRIGDWTYSLRVAEGTLHVERGPDNGPDAVITAEASPLAAVLWHGLSLETALESEAIAVSGDRRVAQEFLTLFPLPS
jgi:DNA-binding HxlR family transcriptional regulator